MSWRHIRDEVRTAIKVHQCELCGLNIPPGTKYVRRVGVDEGHGWHEWDEIYAFAMHFQCERRTHDWDDYDWLFSDHDEFRQSMLREGLAPQ